MKQMMWVRIVHSGDYVYIRRYALLVVHARNDDDDWNKVSR